MTKKRKFSRDSFKRHYLSLDDATVKMARSLGDGNLSLGLRRAVRKIKYRTGSYKRDAQLDWVEISSREERLNRRAPTSGRDSTFPPADGSFYDRIVYLGLQKLKPAGLVIGDHTFGVRSFAWQQPWGFSVSCANDGASKVAVINRLVGEPDPIPCWMKFRNRTIKFDCYLKAMSFDEYKIRLSFVGIGLISEQNR